MDGYTFLSPDQARQIRVDRIHQLEAEHYRALLLIEEDFQDDSAIRAAKQLEKRIKHHTEALNGSMNEHQNAALGPPEEAASEVIG